MARRVFPSLRCFGLSPFTSLADGDLFEEQWPDERSRDALDFLSSLAFSLFSGDLDAACSLFSADLERARLVDGLRAFTFLLRSLLLTLDLRDLSEESDRAGLADFFDDSSRETFEASSPSLFSLRASLLRFNDLSDGLRDLTDLPSPLLELATAAAAAFLLLFLFFADSVLLDLSVSSAAFRFFFEERFFFLEAIPRPWA